MKKSIMLILLASLLIFASCSRAEEETDTYYSPYYTYPPATPTPTPPARPLPTPAPTPTPEPVTVHQAAYPPHFIQITGQIASINGRLTAKGTIPPYVDWLEIHITDENGTPIILAATRETAVPFGGLFAGETVTGYISPIMPVVEGETPTYIVAVLVTGVPRGYGLYIVHFTDEERPRRPFALTSSDGRVFRINESTMFHTNTFDTRRRGFAMVYSAGEADKEMISVPDAFLLNIEEPWCWCFEGPCPLFSPPVIQPLSSFEVLDMPVFIHQELFNTPMPPILYHDGSTVMVPFMPIDQEFSHWDRTTAWMNCSGLMFGTVGGGSGETAMMLAGGRQASGTGLSVIMDVPNINVDGVFYVPLFGFFVGASPFPPSDAFIYNDEIHIVERGWGILHGRWPFQGGWGGSDYPERPITIDVSALPIFVNGVEIDAPPPFLTDDGFDVMLPVTPIKEALGVDWCWLDDTITYAPFWRFFRGLPYGGFISYTRIEIFDAGAQCLWRQMWLDNREDCREGD